MSRTRRLTALTQMLAGKRYSSQEELASALGRNGIEVTQATLSRDLRSLGVAKRAGADGSTWYELPGPAGESLDRSRQMLDLKVFVNETRLAQNLAVVKTPPGHASAVARAIDMLEFEGLVGSVAGDDTVLCVLHDTATAKRFKRHLDSIAQTTGGAQ
ncbi:MAG: arginine repressor [Candidatus Eisenbacteria bacterium]|jgi:transcriptional regulator of arginine metabolism|nr:arginine repressor [Candidatus Eisenbacteria bacterium]MBP8136885.1 arginine repressor [Candidatus Eisenbacteria bacterium]